MGLRLGSLRTMWLPLVLLVVVVVVVVVAQEDGVSPVILIPGDGCSALEVELDPVEYVAPHFYCRHKTKKKYVRLWLDEELLLPYKVNCFTHMMKLHYNQTTGTVSNAPGVSIRPVEGLRGLEVIPSKPSSSPFGKVIEQIRQTNNNNDDDFAIQAATYDFRLSPAGNPEYMQKLKTLVETTVHRTRRKVTLLTHSLGGLMGHYFLTRVVDDEWKARHIHAWVPVSPAYGGAVADLLQVVTGDNGGIRWLKPSDVHDEQRTDESSYWLLPDPHLYDDSTVLVSTPQRDYTAHDYLALWKDSGFGTEGAYIHNRVRDLTPWMEDNKLQDPNVKVYPVYGNGVPTSMQFVYDTTDFRKSPKKILDTMEGDGTVPRISLQAGDGWSQAAPPLILEGATHGGVLSQEALLSLLDEVVQISTESLAHPIILGSER